MGNTDLASQLQNLKDQNRKLKRDLKEAYRKESVIGWLSNMIEVPPLKPLPRSKPWKRDHVTHKEDMCAHISDPHADYIVKPSQVGGLEKYNFNIACGRAEVLIEEIIRIKARRTDVDFQRLHFWMYGDLVNGIIHDAIRRSEWQNSFKSSIMVAQLIALMLRDLASEFPIIEVISIPGNHGRNTKKKDFDDPKDSWDYLVGIIVEMLCRDIDNINFHIPDAYSCIVDVQGHPFHIEHGDGIKAWNGIPYYGIERKTRRLRALAASTHKKAPEYFCLGHFHQPSMLDMQGGKVLMNGAWLATTPYIYNQHAGYSEPTQLVHGVNKKYGLSWTEEVHLRSKGRDYIGERYRLCEFYS